LNNENAVPARDVTLTPSEPLPPTPLSTLHKIFVGKDGLRAGWSLLIFIALFAALAFSINAIGRRLYPPPATSPGALQNISPRQGFILESIPLLLTLFVTWIMSKIERRPVSVYGFGDGRKLPHFFAGFVSGAFCLSLLVLTLLQMRLLAIDARLLSGFDILRYGVIWLFGFLLVGLNEEYLTRGYLQYTLTRGLAGLYHRAFKTRHNTALGFWTAALIFSFLFGFGHRTNPGESPIGLISAGMGGLVFCFSLWRTGSLWWAIGFHTAWDWAQSFLYGVPDSGLMVQHRLLLTHAVGKPLLSGGTTGPEGSIFIIAILPLIAVIILFTLPRCKS
jgi:uncharacterized protein